MGNNKSLAVNSEISNICATCGTRYNMPTGACMICNDERQYVPASGQNWTSHAEIGKTHTIRFSNSLADVYTLRISPAFGIGQRAHFIISPGGNLLWDCIPFLDDTTVAFIKSRGGLRAIAISHPHYYSVMATWADIFECPILLHSADSEWVVDQKSRVSFFDASNLGLWDGMSIVHTGGHFPGSTILHATQIGPSGTLFVGDSLQVSLSRKFISIMYSYPNSIPLKLQEILRISEIVGQLDFDAMYGAFEWQNIEAGAKRTFNASIEKYKEIYLSH